MIRSTKSKDLVRREYEECWSDGDVEILHETCSGDVVLYGLPTAGRSSGIEELKEYITEFRAAVSDVDVSIEDVVAEDDRVVVRSRISCTHDADVFMGVEPEGCSLEINRTTTYRIENGLIAEAWLCFDTLGLLQQMDAVPAHPQSYEWEQLG